MNNIQNIYFSIEIWGALFSLIAALTILLSRHFDKSGSRKLMLTMLCSAALMICDAVSIYFRGAPVENSALIVRWSTFAVHFFSFTDEQIRCSDVNGDGAVDILDTTLIQMFTSGTIDKFPVENA